MDKDKNKGQRTKDKRQKLRDKGQGQTTNDKR